MARRTVAGQGQQRDGSGDLEGLTPSLTVDLTAPLEPVEDALAAGWVQVRGSSYRLEDAIRLGLVVPDEPQS